MNIKGFLLAAALLTTSTASLAGIITIDTFDTDQATITATVGDTVGSSVFGAGILGGERDLSVTNYGALLPGYTASIGVANGLLSFSADSTVDASFSMQWDGADNSSTINTNGLADATGKGVDMSGLDAQNSFLTETLFADFTYFFDVTLWWNNGQDSEKLTLLGPGHSDFANPYEAFLPFEAFDLADLTDISAIQVDGNVLSPAGIYDDFGQLIEANQRVRAFDVTLGSISAVSVPEPTGILLMGMGLMGLGLVSRANKRNS